MNIMGLKYSIRIKEIDLQGGLYTIINNSVYLT